MVLVSYNVEWMDVETRKTFGGVEIFHDPMSDSLIDDLPRRITKIHGVDPDQVKICGICEIERSS